MESFLVVSLIIILLESPDMVEAESLLIIDDESLLIIVDDESETVVVLSLVLELEQAVARAIIDRTKNADFAMIQCCFLLVNVNATLNPAAAKK